MPRYEFTKCNTQYIGQTSRKFNIRMKEHLTDIRKAEDKVIGTHFNLPGHSFDDFSVQVIEKSCLTLPICSLKEKDFGS